MIDFLKVTSEPDIAAVEKLASIIWHHHYEPIIGLSQVKYMLDKFQSFEAIQSQIEDHYEYYLIHYKNTSVGYISIKLQGEALFLSKIYVLSEFRGKKIGKTAMQFIYERAETLGCDKIRLTVNKYNAKSIAAYERMGFKSIEAIVIDIGNGFIMDDYKMEKPL